MDNSTCAVLVPVASTIEPECESALRVLTDRGYSVRLLKGSSQIDLARSMMASQALDAGFTETMWIDSDIAFDPDDVDLLRSHNLPLAAGLYMRKGPAQFAAKFLDATTALTVGTGGGLLEMQYVGMGFTHIRAEVYRAIDLPRCGGAYDPTITIVPYFIPLLAPDGNGGLCYLSEDYSFIARARAVGFVPYADTTIRLGHIGRYQYTWDSFLVQRSDSIQVNISQPLIADVRSPR